MSAFLRPLGAWCGYTAAASMAIASVWYVGEVVFGSSVTNPISWWLWLVETGVSLTLYADRTRDVPKWLTEAISMSCVAVVAGYLAAEAVSGNAKIVLAPVKPVDYLATAFAVFAFSVWLATRKKNGAGLALLVFQLALFSAAFPIIRATIVDPSTEPFWPWALWTGSFILQGLAAGLRWDGFVPLMNPVNYAITHGVVAWIVWQGVA